jgi:hypothetical protein
MERGLVVGAKRAVFLLPAGATTYTDMIMTNAERVALSGGAGDWR